MAVILNSGHLGFSHLSSFLSNSLTLANISSQLFAQKKNFTHSFWLKLMIAAILNSAMLDSDTAILDSDTLSSSLRLTQKHSSSTLTLTQTNSIWLNLMMAAILNSAMLDSAILDSAMLHKTLDSDQFNLTQTHSFWLDLMMATILNSAMLVSDTAILDSNTLLIFSQIHSKWLFLYSDFDSNSFILTELDDGSHLEFWPSWIQPS